MTGKISVGSKGVGYVEIEGSKNEIEVDFNHLNRALHGDIVEILPHPKRGQKITGEVTDILARAKDGFAGVLEVENGMYFLKPDDTKMYTDILIPEAKLNGASKGQKVYVKIHDWPDAKKAPQGSVVKIIGTPGEHETEMQSIVLEKGMGLELPEAIEAEAQKIKQRGITTKDAKNRRDFRGILTFTIDPADAKDFDDALSFQNLGNGKFEIGIHIADVTHFVKTGSPIDQEAQKRATSIYLVDRTIPMLPEVLSNDLCSLVPNEDRLTMSAVFTMNQNADVLDSWFGKTIIRSDHRFTYEEAEQAIKSKSGYLHTELTALNKIAKKLTEDRFKNGAISIETEEVKFVLDAENKPVRVIKKIRGDSNKLIEEFMLLANKKVAERVSQAFKKEGVFVYRVHDLPSKEKMEDLAYFLKGLGYKFNLKKGIIPNKELNAILKQNQEGDAVSRAITRSMAKAIYTTENIGHYGLGFSHYTHFTSPIRRYPDMAVHRILNDFLQNKKINNDDLQLYEKISRVSSEQEKKASEAERASIKYKQVEYMRERLGQVFSGVISGVSEWGIYVEEVETKCEGLVRIKDMEDDFYVLNEKKMELVGKRSKKAYRLGDRVKIKVKNADLEKKVIDYILV